MLYANLILDVGLSFSILLLWGIFPKNTSGKKQLQYALPKSKETAAFENIAFINMQMYQLFHQIIIV